MSGYRSLACRKNPCGRRFPDFALPTRGVQTFGQAQFDRNSPGQTFIQTGQNVNKTGLCCRACKTRKFERQHPRKPYPFPLGSPSPE